MEQDNPTGVIFFWLYMYIWPQVFYLQLKRKTAELNKACEKQYRLEQELAFHKIDAKFEPLAFRHDIEEVIVFGRLFKFQILVNKADVSLWCIRPNDLS